MNIIFLISQPKHVVGTQMNRLNEMVLYSTQNMIKLTSRKINENFKLFFFFA